MTLTVALDPLLKLLTWSAPSNSIRVNKFMFHVFCFLERMIWRRSIDDGFANFVKTIRNEPNQKSFEKMQSDLTWQLSFPSSPPAQIIPGFIL